MVAPQILVLIVGVRILLGENFRIIPELDLNKSQFTADRTIWSLRISV